MASAIYRFGEFRLDPARHELWRGDEELSLRLKVYSCIVHLIENRDRAVGRDELIEAVWGDVHLSDSVLGQAILQARHALGDTGEEQRYIQTVRGFGYRWAAPVEVEEAADEEVAGAARPGGAAPLSVPSPAGRRRIGPWLLLSILAVVTLVAGTLYLMRRDGDRRPQAPRPPRGAGEIALLLPVAVDADHAWARLGLMALIAERLRAAGQAMVPSDTVIALLRGADSEPGADTLDRLRAATGARLVLAGRARVRGSRWTVSLHSRRGARPPLTAVGESHDMLAAAGLAADRMAAALGLTPTAEAPGREPELEMLLRRLEAARLAEQTDVARRLIEEAAPALRRHPEIRFRRASLDFYDHRLTAARQALEALLGETSAERDPVFRARVLNRLAAVHATAGDRVTAEPLMEEAARLLRGEEPMPILGAIHVNLGNVAQEEHADFAAAREHMGHARRIYEAIGDVDGLASVDFNVGVLETRRERYAAARRFFERAAERRAAVHNVAGELNARAYRMRCDLLLLDPQAAATAVPRLEELQARTTNPGLIARANLSRVYLLEATGRRREADALLRKVLATTETHGDLRAVRVHALTAGAERARRDGDAPRAARLAREVVERLAGDRGGIYSDIRGRAWLVLVRARLARGDLAGAAAAATEMGEWAEHDPARSPRIYARLAEAELAAREGRPDAAGAAFERALALADRTRVPMHLLRVAQSYVPWLLRGDAGGGRGPERAVLVAERLAGAIDRHYGAALVQLRVYHALGPPSAWRVALTRTLALAGERRIPPELTRAP